MAAIDKGYFAEEGIEVDLTSAGGGVAVPAVISGSLDELNAKGWKPKP